MVHGTRAAYQDRKCRCDICKRGWADYTAEYRKRRKAQGGPKDIRHGTVGAYTNWGCRCAECSSASTAQQATHYAQNRHRILAANRLERARAQHKIDDLVIARAEHLASARTDATGELALVIKDQEREERRFRINRPPYHYSWEDLYRGSEAESIVHRHVPDFSELVIATVDRRREIDSYAETA